MSTPLNITENAAFQATRAQAFDEKYGEASRIAKRNSVAKPLEQRDRCMNTFLAVNIAEGFEEGTYEEVRAAWQYLHDTGLAYRLQGCFGRRAKALVEEGYIDG